MPTAIILGLPKQQADRVKGALKGLNQTCHNEWQVHFVPPTGAHGQLREADIRVAIRNASQATDSAHVFGIVNQGGDRKRTVAENFTPYFRFRWLPSEWLALPHPAPDDFVAKLIETLADEDEWKELVQPANTADALLLPKCAFSTKLSDLWSLAEKYGPGCNNGCARRKQIFRTTHYRSCTSKSHPKDYFWTDDDQRIFDHTGAQHANAPEPRQWKYSYRLPDKFHYDVRHASGRKFVLNGITGSQSIKAGEYENIDAHGYFREATK